MDDSVVSMPDHLQATLSSMAFALNCVEEPIAWTDASGKIQWCNAAFETLVNQKAPDLVNQPLTQILPLTLEGDALPLAQHPVAQGLATQQSQVGQYGFDHGLMLSLTVTPRPCAEDDRASPGVMLMIRKVTPQLPQPRSMEISAQPDQQHNVDRWAEIDPKELEAPLPGSEQWFGRLFNTTAVGMVTAALDGSLVQVNAACCQMLGYTQAELLAKTCEQLVHPDDLKAGVEPLRKLLAGETLAYHTIRRYFHKKGHIVWGLVSLSTVCNTQQHPVYVIYQVQDITERQTALHERKQTELALQQLNQELEQLNQELEQRVKQRTAQLELVNQQLQTAIAAHEQTEAALRKSEERFRIIFDYAPIAISLSDAQTYQIVEINRAHQTLFGYSNAEIKTKTHVDIAHPDDAYKNVKQIQQLLKGQITRFQLEKRFVKKNGEWIWANLTVALIRDSDGRAYTLGMLEDITDRKKAEEALYEKQQLLQRVMDSVPVSIFWKDKNLRYMGCNHQFAIDAGFASPSDIIGKSDFELPWAEHAERCQAEDMQVLSTDQPTPTVEGSLVKAGGEQCWIRTSKVPLHDQNGSVVGILGTYEDITERRQTDQALRLTQFSIDRAVDPVWWVESDGSIYYVNDAACRDLGYPREAIIGKRVSDFNPDRLIEEWDDHWQLIKAQGAMTFEARVRAKDGTFFPAEVTANYIELNGKEYHCSFVRNITRRKCAEAQLMASLAEKEVLLKEVHHRVKNNLQTVSSLLNLQASTIQDPNILAPFQDSQRRIKAMSLVHERLYQSGCLEKVNFSNYVHHLVTDLIHSYSIDPTKIRLKLELAPLELPVQTVVSCGLIINELVTNALKHAFPDDRSGEIRIAFSVPTANQCLLVLADDGIGFLASMAASNAVPSSNSLGLQLVHAFVHQLRGTIKLDCEFGSHFELLFPHPV
ncbi:MAG: PAS domain S-box protein [Leptolyngbya sp. BL-A-14]